MTSTSATTITVNTGLFAAGDTVFIQNLGTANLTITAGTATVNTAGSLILPQYDAGILYFVSSSSAVFYDYIQVGAVSPLTTKGDLYGFSTLDARIPIGANDTVLTADSTQSLGLKWAAPASGGGITQIQSITASNQASVEFTSIPGTYKNIYIVGRNLKSANDGVGGYFRFNSDSTASRHARVLMNDGQYANTSFSASEITFTTSIDNSVAIGGFYIEIPDYANTTQIKRAFWSSFPTNGTTSTNFTYSAGNAYYNQTGAVTSFEIKVDTGNITSGTFILYGVN
jgi:hypothetical protein